MQSSSHFLKLYTHLLNLFISIVCFEKADWYIACEQCKVQMVTDCHILEQKIRLNNKDTIKHAEGQRKGQAREAAA